MQRRRPLLPLLGLAALVAAAAGCGGASGSSTILDSTASPGAPAAPGPSTFTDVPTTSSPATTSAPVLSLATTGAATSTSPSAGVSAELRIRIWERGKKAGQPIVGTLSCGATPTGTLKDPAAACEQLAAVGAAAFAPVGADRVCTMIYGGDSEATIVGTFSGRPVSASYSLRNGCEIARWDRLSTILAAHTPTATSVTP